jgi:hypothetical protein
MIAHSCSLSIGLSILERGLRTGAQFHNNRVAAQFGDLANSAMRRQFSHVENCLKCLAAEAIAR